MKLATNANEYNNVQRQEEEVVDWEENQKASQIKVMGPVIAIVIPRIKSFIKCCNYFWTIVITKLKVLSNVAITSELN